MVWGTGTRSGRAESPHMILPISLGWSLEYLLNVLSFADGQLETHGRFFSVVHAHPGGCFLWGFGPPIPTVFHENVFYQAFGSFTFLLLSVDCGSCFVFFLCDMDLWAMVSPPNWGERWLKSIFINKYVEPLESCLGTYCKGEIPCASFLIDFSRLIHYYFCRQSIWLVAICHVWTPVFLLSCGITED